MNAPISIAAAGVGPEFTFISGLNISGPCPVSKGWTQWNCSAQISWLWQLCCRLTVWTWSQVAVIGEYQVAEEEIKVQYLLPVLLCSLSFPEDLFQVEKQAINWVLLGERSHYYFLLSSLVGDRWVHSLCGKNPLKWVTLEKMQWAHSPESYHHKARIATSFLGMRAENPPETFSPPPPLFHRQSSGGGVHRGAPEWLQVAFMSEGSYTV